MKPEHASNMARMRPTITWTDDTLLIYFRHTTLLGKSKKHATATTSSSLSSTGDTSSGISSVLNVNGKVDMNPVDGLPEVILLSLRSSRSSRLPWICPREGFGKFHTSYYRVAHIALRNEPKYRKQVALTYVGALGLKLAQAIITGDQSNLAREILNQDVLGALENFVASLVSRQIAQKSMETQTRGAKNSERSLESNSNHNPNENVTDNGNITRSTQADSELLKSVLQQAHRRVFNKMPIRLLAFRSDGSGMELIERSTIWERVSSSIRSNIAGLKASVEYAHADPKVEKKAIEDFISSHARYAILSHTWLHGTPGEVTYANWKAGDFDETSSGYQKLARFCKAAAVEHGITLGWMDTICINKESSSELDESIRSMFKWYSDASLCITYLAQTTSVDHMHADAWFTRGWTLQELLAPQCTKFYGKHWQKIAVGESKYDIHNHLIQEEISAATTITRDELISFQESRDRTPISRRMQWAARREVTREEDMAYSLMGIFDVSISIAYGEGSERAFYRLMSEILASARRDVLDIVNWCIGPEARSALERSTSTAHPSSLLPTHPSQYLWRSKEDIRWFPLLTPVTLTHVGLRVQVLIMRALAAEDPDAKFYGMGSYSATTVIDAEDPIDPTKRLLGTYNLMDSKLRIIPRDYDYENPNTSRLLFGVLNFGETDETVILPSSACLAICLHTHSKSPVASIETSNVRKIETSGVITFNVERYGPYISMEIQKDSLVKHGMMLYTLHL